MASMNRSILATILLDVCSKVVAMLLANSAPGMVGGLGDCDGVLTFG